MPGFPAAVMMILLNLVFLVVPLGAVVFFGWLGLRFVRARERESGLTNHPSRAEIRRLEEQLDALQAEVRSLREHQTFLEKLLERPRQEPTA